jgi:hypothetical protein
MGVIPKKTTPLTKFVRTGEGVLVFAFNLTMLIVPIVSNALSPEDAVKWAGIVNGVAVISRTGLKVVAEVSKATGIEPQPIGNLSGQVITADAGGPAADDDAVEVPAPPVQASGGATADDDAVEAPASPMSSPVQATASSDPLVSDEEEFGSVPPPGDDDDDSVDVSAPSDEESGGLEPAAVAVPADPVVTDGGGGHLS